MTRKITPQMTVAQVATSHPELVPELERLGLDYCCGGSRSLGEAAARAGLEPAETVRRLTTFTTPERCDDTDWSARSMTELADHIEATHHAFAREALDRLGTLTAKCVAAHADDEPRLRVLQDTVTALTDDMHDHFVREEQVVFPWLRRLERPTEIQSGPPWSVRRPIDCMIHDHDDVAAAFARMHELTDDLTPPEGACPTWRECYRVLDDLERDTHLHIHKENNILFPAGIEAERRRGHQPRRSRQTPPTASADSPPAS